MLLKTATLTFHAAHNYGSMLQAFALQFLIRRLGIDNEIINLRTDRQKFIYRHPEDNQGAGWVSKYAGSSIRFFFKQDLIRKYELFEKFLQEDLKLSPELKDTEAVEGYCQKKHFDYYIVGSDQIWNTACSDFDWSYYLPFANNNAISYACSMGPHAMEQVSQNNYARIRSCLSQFKGVSVREVGTANVVNVISGIKPEIHFDPTLLLTAEDWVSKSRIPDVPLIEGEYIFLYSPGYNKDAYKIAKDLSKKLALPVVVSNLHPRSLLLYSSFKLHLDCGPWEFLNLVKYAKVVVCGSFHAVVFSTVFRTPFFAVNGDKDNRMINILTKLGLGKQTITLQNIDKKIPLINTIDWTCAEDVLLEERNRSVNYLKGVLK